MRPLATLTKAILFGRVEIARADIHVCQDAHLIGISKGLWQKQIQKRGDGIVVQNIRRWHIIIEKPSI